MALALVCALLLTSATAVSAQRNGKSNGRLLFGKVLDPQDNPVPDAVVYLTNTRTRAIKTYIVGPEGTYRFPALSAAVDYEVYAQYNGQKSDNKTVSQFDDRKTANIILRIDAK